MTDDNILQQYQFLWLVELVHRFVLSLDRLNLEITEVVESSETRNELNRLVGQITTGLAENGLDIISFEAKENSEEINSIWASILSECRGIQNVLLNLTSGTGDEISNKILKAAEDLRNNEISPSLIMFLKFLSTSDSIKNVIEEPNLEEVFGAC